MPEKSLSIQNKSLVPARAYWEASETRRWELAINYQDKLYLTDSERKFFVEMVTAGKEVISIGDLTLSNKFLYLAPVQDAPGKWEYVDEHVDIVNSFTGERQTVIRTVRRLRGEK